MKTGCTSGKKNFVFTFHSVCTVFVPFKMEHFQSALTIRDLHNYKGVPYELLRIFREKNWTREGVWNAFLEKMIIENRPR